MLKLLALLFLLFISLKNGIAPYLSPPLNHSTDGQPQHQRTIEDLLFFGLPDRLKPADFSPPSCGKIHPNDTEPRHGRGCFSRWTLGETLGRQSGQQPTPGNNPDSQNIGGNRIYGGDSAGIGAYPWTVLITLDGDKVCPPEYIPVNASYESRCTGAIITTQWVMTAAHCVYDQTLDNMTIWFGEPPVRNRLLPHRVVDKKVHDCFYAPVNCPDHPEPDPAGDCPNYVNNTPHYMKWSQFDIALLRSDELTDTLGHFEIDWVNNIYIANAGCYPNRSYPVEPPSWPLQQDLFVTGWGLMGNRDWHTGYLETPYLAPNLQVKPIEYQGWVVSYNYSVVEYKCEIGNSVCGGDSGTVVFFNQDGRIYFMAVIFEGNTPQQIPPHESHPGEPWRNFSCAASVAAGLSLDHDIVKRWIRWVIDNPL